MEKIVSFLFNHDISIPTNENDLSIDNSPRQRANIFDNIKAFVGIFSNSPLTHLCMSCTPITIENEKKD